MRRITTATRATDLFGPGKDGFRDGNLALAILPTDLNADLFNQLQEEIANVVEGTGIALNGADMTQLLQAIRKLTSAPVGSTRNLRATVAAASSSIVFTADEVVVAAALGGGRTCLPNFNKTLNIATVGAGGMDTGAAPASGYVAIYAINNLTTGTSALLGVNASATIAPEIYGGANMPAGYTQSALIGVWPTTAGSQFPIGMQKEREVSRAGVSVLNTPTLQASYTSFSIAAAVPRNAVSCDMIMQQSASVAAQIAFGIAADANGTGFASASIGSATQIGVTFSNLPILTPQAVFYIASQSTGTTAITATISKYRF